MPKFRCNSKICKETVNSIHAYNKNQAIAFFAQIKALSTEKFLQLYEVIEG